MEKIKDWWSDLHYSQAQKRSLVLVAGFVLVATSFFILRSSSSSEAITPPPALTVDVAASTITIDVQGAVLHPGVYSIPIGSRVIDGIKAAGGLAKNADPSDLNQARVIADGEQIYVYASAKGLAASGRAPQVRVRSSGYLSINRATAKEFEALDGIGPVLAARIVAYRKANGPFASIDDLEKVPGIGASTLAKFKSKLRV